MCKNYFPREVFISKEIQDAIIQFGIYEPKMIRRHFIISELLSGLQFSKEQRGLVYNESDINDVEINPHTFFTAGERADIITTFQLGCKLLMKGNRKSDKEVAKRLTDQVLPKLILSIFNKETF